MKNVFLLLLLGAVAFSSCDKDDDTVPVPDNVLHYDGPNQTGPLLAAGYHEAAVRFTTNELLPFQGKQLTEVEFFMGIAPAEASLKIYGAGSNDLPGDLLYSANILPGIKIGEWTTHALGAPIDIPNDELWISIGLKHDVEQQSIGCDAGPNQTNGDWLFSNSDSTWETYIDRTSESVNWNIRGVVSE